ncbi:MAG: hypothetical protein EOO38_26875 [Cytophagaceae bacterium]|nr:MAG: hypothetical protein EOO38_26875 [Cytophagaceae bacterium]
MRPTRERWRIRDPQVALAAAGNHIRSFPASFQLFTFHHPFVWAAEEVLSLSPARYPASFPKKDRISGKYSLPKKPSRTDYGKA